MIESQLYKVDQQLDKLMVLWTHRKTQLETCQRVIDFKGEVPQMMLWLETRGVELLQNKNNFGRSKEEVRVHVSKCPIIYSSLLTNHVHYVSWVTFLSFLLLPWLVCYAHVFPCMHMCVKLYACI